MAQSKITRNRKTARPAKKNGKRSSVAARRLIKAYLRHYGNERAAAAALGMSRGQLNGIKSGRLRDTAAMKVALDRADARARRAWAKLDHEKCETTINAPATLRAIERALGQAQVMIDALINQVESCDHA